jgi:hypothetical protein
MGHRHAVRPALAAALIAAAAFAAAQPAPAPVPAPVPTGLSLARLALVERLVEQAGGAEKWRKAKEGGPLRVGERLRTADDAVARIEFAWMAVTVSPSSVVSFPDEQVLSTVLDQGRVALQSDKREILKLLSGEAEVRGRGRVVVRREAQTTLVTCLSGRFEVEAGGETVVLGSGKGTVVRPGQPPLAPVAVLAPPAEPSPGSDPVYVAPGESLALNWKPSGRSHQIEILPVGSDVVLVQRDVGLPPWQAQLPWEGAFRWRVSARDSRGLEGLPSADGLFCVDEK